jgi:hypothetical protein
MQLTPRHFPTKNARAGFFYRQRMLNEMSPLRILLLTTCYPSYDEDPSGVFLAKLAAAIRKRGHSLTVLAPSDGTYFGKLSVDKIETYRFGYFWPRSMLRLTRGSGGIPENMAKSWLARIQLYPMMTMFLLQSLLIGSEPEL